MKNSAQGERLSSAHGEPSRTMRTLPFDYPHLSISLRMTLSNVEWVKVVRFSNHASVVNASSQRSRNQNLKSSRNEKIPNVSSFQASIKP